MLVIETITGNIYEPAWQARLEEATLDWLALDQWEAQKSRLRKLSRNGIDLAISLPRGILLRDGDVCGVVRAHEIAGSDPGTHQTTRRQYFSLFTRGDGDLRVRAFHHRKQERVPRVFDELVSCL